MKHFEKIKKEHDPRKIILTKTEVNLPAALTRDGEPANNKKMLHLRITDIGIILLALAVSVASLFLFQSLDGAEEVHVTTDQGQWVYDLSVDTMVDFTGPVGITTMAIEDGKVHVHKSDCRNQLCVLAGEIEHGGEWVACLPNNVFIVIKGSPEAAGEGEVDDTSF